MGLNATSLLNGLSSVSSFALGQPGPQLALTIATLVGIGFTAASGLALITYKEWKTYEEKKHKDKMLEVNTLCRKFLQNLKTASGVDVPNMPIVFQFSADLKTVDSLHYNDEEIDAIGKAPPEVPPELTNYRQAILDAILALKEYYIHLDDSDDVVKGVLSYLLNILENRCLSFVGFDYDITYLKAIIDFVTAYASRDNTEDSPHFSHLKPVFSKLEDAVQDLERHKESMSLLQLVNEARLASLDESDKLIRLLVKMVIASKYQKLAETVRHSDLKNDIVREKYIDHTLWKIPIFHQSKVELPNSIFHNWIMGISKYYLLSEKPTAILRQSDAILRPEELFSFINWARPKLAQKKLAAKDKKKPPLSKEDENKLHKGLQLIHHVFKQSPNFINSKLSGSDDDPKFVVIKDGDELLNASEVLAHYTHLIHGVISLQAYCAEISTEVERLGLDFFDNQDNFRKIFTTMNTLYGVVEEDVRLMKEKIREISKANKNTLRLADKIQLQKAVSAAIDNIEARILPAADKVRDYKNKHPKTVDDSFKEVLAASQFFQELYGVPPTLPMTPKLPEPPKSVEPQKAEPTKLEQPKLPKTIAEMEAALNEFSSNLFMEVSKIHEEMEEDPQAQQYQKIYNALRDLQIKSITMLKEKKQGSDRLNKAQNLYKLVYSLYEDTIQFLSQAPTIRSKEADAFIGKIHEQLNCVENCAFIDRHLNGFSKLLYDNLGFFNTATRNKLSILEEACQNIKTNARVELSL